MADSSVLEVSEEELKASILLFYSLLDEQRRWTSSAVCVPDWSRLNWAVAATANWPTSSTSILTPWPTDDKQFSSGHGSGPRAQNGRRAQAGGKRTPEIIAAIEVLLEHDTAGDPITELKWSRKTTEKIAAVLQEVDIPVSANTVARLLYEMNFSLRVN